MTKQEAIQAMQQGKKVTHQYFTPDEWMTMEDGLIILEDGVRCKPFEFWQWRNSEKWEDGYSMLNEAVQTNGASQEKLNQGTTPDLPIKGEEDIYDSVYMEVVELVEKDNRECEAYKETALKLMSKYKIEKR
jgi:hypothetical protein